MYVSGRWSLAQFEAHLEAMLPVFTLEDWTPWQMRSNRRRTAKQAADEWSAIAAQKAANYTTGVSAIKPLGGHA